MLVISESVPARITMTVDGSPAVGHRRAEPLGDRQHRHEHDDDAGDADDGDRRRTKPLRNAADVDGCDRRDLCQPLEHVRTSSTAYRLPSTGCRASATAYLRLPTTCRLAECVPRDCESDLITLPLAHRRCAAGSPGAPAAAGGDAERQDEADADTRSRAGRKKTGRKPPVGSPPCVTTSASARPMPPPSAASRHDSAAPAPARGRR